MNEKLETRHVHAHAKRKKLRKATKQNLELNLLAEQMMMIKKE